MSMKAAARSRQESRSGPGWRRCESNEEGPSHSERWRRARGGEERSAKNTVGPPGSDGEAREPCRSWAFPNDSSLFGSEGNLREICRLNKGVKSDSNKELQ